MYGQRFESNPLLAKRHFPLELPIQNAKVGSRTRITRAWISYATFAPLSYVVIRAHHFFTNISSIVSISSFAVRALNFFCTIIITDFSEKVKIRRYEIFKEREDAAVWYFTHYRTRIASARSDLYPGHRFRRSLVEDVGLEPRLRIPNAVCYHYTTSSMLVLCTGLEPIFYPWEGYFLTC